MDNVCSTATMLCAAWGHNCGNGRLDAGFTLLSCENVIHWLCGRKSWRRFLRSKSTAITHSWGRSGCGHQDHGRTRADTVELIIFDGVFERRVRAETARRRHRSAGCKPRGRRRGQPGSAGRSPLVDGERHRPGSSQARPRLRPPTRLASEIYGVEAPTTHIGLRGCGIHAVRLGAGGAGEASGAGGARPCGPVRAGSPRARPNRAGLCRRSTGRAESTGTRELPAPQGAGSGAGTAPGPEWPEHPDSRGGEAGRRRPGRSPRAGSAGARAGSAGAGVLAGGDV